MQSEGTKEKEMKLRPSLAGASSKLKLSLSALCEHYTWIPRKSQKPDSADSCVRK